MGLPLRIALALGAVAIGSLAAARAFQSSAQPTFDRDIAPLGFRHCAPCHRPGQPGPFSLLTYADYREHARDIADVVEDRYMPPWKPAGRSGRYLGERGLSAAEIALFRRWVESGARQGERRDLPAQPSWPTGWNLGEPDLVLQLTAAYELPASGEDSYRNFVIPAPVARMRYVSGWEFKPNTRAIHHAILQVDRMGNARRADEADPEPGFADMDFEGAQSPDGFYLVWAPGKSASRTTDGSAWRIDQATDLVLQLHLQTIGKTERIDPQIALYFSDRAPTQRRVSLRIGDVPIDIPAGARDYAIEDALVLPAEVRVLGLFPHAHYLAKRMRVYSRLPDGSQLELLRIDDWDFKWQDEYSFSAPPLLPRGSTLQMRFEYDNSTDNPHNPSSPPLRVRTGKRSRDEMGNVTFQLAPVHPEETDRLLEAKYRRALGPKPSAQALYNLANALGREQQLDEAVAYYRAALKQQPEFSAARYNLGGLLATHGRPDVAVQELTILLAQEPNHPGARLALAHALEELGQLAGAVEQYRLVLAREPGQAQAKALLKAAEWRLDANP
jgi:hypothetical protein